MPLTPKKQEKEKKEVSLKELFQGTVLDSSIEAARVKGLDEFLNKSDPSKPVIKSALSRIFQAYNPGVDPEVIDWDAVSDTNLSISENRELFAAEYPQYRWYGEEEENPFTEELLRVVNQAREAGLTNRQISASIAQVRKELGLGQTKEAQKTIAELRKQIEELKASQPKVEFARTSEIRPVGFPSPGPTAQKPAVSTEQERRFATVLAQRILASTSPFETLGVTASSTDEQVRNARNQLLTLFHPDVFPDTALGNQVSQKINTAYEQVATEAQRRALEAKQARPPSVEVAVGRPVLYCQRCAPQQGLVIMQYEQTFGPYSSGRSYDLYRCPVCAETTTVNFLHGQVLGVS